MEKNRLEAFSDGVLAIIITIMVLDLHVPTGSDIAVLKPLLCSFSPVPHCGTPSNVPNDFITPPLRARAG